MVAYVRNMPCSRRQQRPETLRPARHEASKKRKLSSPLAEDVDEDNKSYVDSHLGESKGEEVVGGTPAPWIASHEREYKKAGLVYSPAHVNPMCEACRRNSLYKHLTPQHQKCILYWDEMGIPWLAADAALGSFLELWLARSRHIIVLFGNLLINMCCARLPPI